NSLRQCTNTSSLEAYRRSGTESCVRKNCSSDSFHCTHRQERQASPLTRTLTHQPTHQTPHKHKTPAPPHTPPLTNTRSQTHTQAHTHTNTQRHTHTRQMDNHPRVSQIKPKNICCHYYNLHTSVLLTNLLRRSSLAAAR